jgi:hypothetical protein
MSRGKTIQIYLTDGEPTGIRTAELTTSISKAVLIPRKRLSEASNRTEVSQAGLYFLFENQGFGEEARVYIGQSLNCFNRLKQHNSDGKKDYWNLAVAFITKDNSFTPTHLSFLEQMAISEANEANRFSVENAVQPANFVISESMEAECQDHFDSIKLLLGTLGLPVFKRLNETSPAAEGMDQVFTLKQRGANARGTMSDEGFVILAGSKGPVVVTDSYDDGKKALRQKLIERGVLKVEGDEIVFTEDYLSETPSGAAVLVCGRSANGWTSWTNDKGVTIDTIFRKSKD